LNRTIRKAAVATLLSLFSLSVSGATLAPAYADEPGVTPTEITIGGDHPFSGPASAYGVIGKGIGAYFNYVNDHGGVNGRKITWIDKDDAYSPPQAVQVVHQLVEQNHAFLILNSLGTGVNVAIRPYLNQNKIPQLFVATGATTFGRDYKEFPWTIGWQPDYQAETIIDGHDILKNHSKAKVGVIYQNDDYGNDLLTGLKKGLGAQAGLIVKTASYETTDQNVSSQISTLKAAGADTLLIFATPKFAVQSLIAVSQQSWHPFTYMNLVSATAPLFRAAQKAGGPSAVNGVISASYVKDPADHERYANDAGMKLYKTIMSKYLVGADQDDGFYLYGMAVAFSTIDCLTRAGKDLTREKVMDAATHLDETNNPFMYPGVKVQTTPTYRFPVSQMVFGKWDAAKQDFVPFGPVIDARQFTTQAEH